MTYNAKDAKEAKGQGLPEDSILVGVVTSVNDGKIKDFVEEQYHSKFEGGVEKPAINVEMEVVHPESKAVIKLHQMFTYIDDNGKTAYTSKSNLGKFKNKYGKLPEAGDQVKVITDENGFGRIKLD